MRRGKTGRNEFLARQNKRKGNFYILFLEEEELHCFGSAGRKPGTKNGRIIYFQRFRNEGSFISSTATVLTKEQHGKQAAFTGLRFTGSILGFIQERQKGGNLQQRGSRIHIRQHRNRRHIPGRKEPKRSDFTQADIQRTETKGSERIRSGFFLAAGQQLAEKRFNIRKGKAEKQSGHLCLQIFTDTVGTAFRSDEQGRKLFRSGSIQQLTGEGCQSLRSSRCILPGKSTGSQIIITAFDSSLEQTYAACQGSDGEMILIRRHALQL